MATQGEWQLVSRRKRFPDNWRQPSDVELDKVRAYTPYPSFRSYAQVARSNIGTISTSTTSSNTSAKTSPTNSRPTTPNSPPTTRFFTSPHSPTTLRFPPLPSYPEWRGRCFRCCKVGHSIAQCTNPKRCGQCWKEGHIASKCKAKTSLNPTAKPFHPEANHHIPKKPIPNPTNRPAMLQAVPGNPRGEPDFGELLMGPPPTEPPVLPDDRQEKTLCFVERDEAFYLEEDKLQRAVVMYGEDQALLMDAQRVLRIAVDTGLVREEEVRVAELSRERFLIHLPSGLPVENFLRKIPAWCWGQGFRFQQWSRMDEGMVRMPRFKMLVDLVGLPTLCWREDHVSKAISGFGVFLGTVAPEHPTDHTAYRAALATDDLRRIPKTIGFVAGGVEYPVQVRPVAWEKGPLYGPQDFPAPPVKYSRPPAKEPYYGSEDSSNPESGDDEEMIHCSKRVLQDICKSLEPEQIPPELRELLAGEDRSGELPLRVIREVVFATENPHEQNSTAFQQGEMSHQTGRITSAPQDHTDKCHNESDDYGTTPLFEEDPSRSRGHGLLNETNLHSVPTVGASLPGTAQPSTDAMLEIPPEYGKGGSACDMSEAGHSQANTKGSQAEHHTSRSQRIRANAAAKAKNAGAAAKLGPNTTSRHKRFTGAMGRGRGRGMGNRGAAGHVVILSRPQHKEDIRMPQQIPNPKTSLHATEAAPKERDNHTTAGGPQATPRAPQRVTRKGKEIAGSTTAQQDPKEGPNNKRKPSAHIKIPNRPEGEAKRLVQQAKGGKNFNKAAQAELTPDGFFQVHVDMQLCSEIGKACGTSLHGVVQALNDDNSDRRLNHFAQQQQAPPESSTLPLPTGEEEMGDLDLDFEIDPDDQFDTDEECQ